MPHKVRHVLFDLGGVVVRDARPGLMAAEGEYFGIAGQDFQERFQPYVDRAFVGGCSLEQAYGAFVREQGYDRDARRAFGIHMDVFRECGTVDAEMLELIAHVRRTHPVSCLSNIEPEVAAYLRETGLFRHFDNAILSCEWRMKKPDRALYDRIADWLRLPVGALMLIDDRVENFAGYVSGFHYSPGGTMTSFREQVDYMLAWPGRRKKEDVNQLPLFQQK